MFELTFNLNAEAKKLRDAIRKFSGKGKYGVWINFIKDLGTDLLKALSDATPVGARGGGTARSSWVLRHKGAGAWHLVNTARTDDGVPYPVFLEEGSAPGEPPWPSPGPRTRFAKGAIYSSQAVGGILANAKLESIVHMNASHFLDDVFKEFRW